MNLKIKKLLLALTEGKPATGWDTANMSPKEKEDHWLQTYSYGKDHADEKLHYDRHPEDRDPNAIKLPGDNYQEPTEANAEKAIAVAQHPGSKTKDLSALANHSNMEVRKHVASNPNTHPMDLLNLANEGHHEEVASNPVLPFVLKSFEENPKTAVQVLPKILSSSFMNHPDNLEAKNEIHNFINKSTKPDIRLLGQQNNFEKDKVSSNTNKTLPDNEDEPLSNHRHDINADKFYDDNYWNELIKKSFKHEDIMTKLKNKDILFN